jgi:hypothetical protein
VRDGRDWAPALVTFALSADHRPLDAFSWITRNGTAAATTWFLAELRYLTFESWIAGLGRLAQRLETAEPLAYLGLHPLAGDALITATREAEAPGEFRRIA